MKIDSGLSTENDFHDLDTLTQRSRDLEISGFDGMLIAEMAHDPFLPFMIAANETTRLEMRTSIAVALSRNPMIMANLGHDLNAYSKGRFTLGLGSQIKPHIEKRFGMPWHGPAKQMREFVLALHAIWDNWYEGKPLSFSGEYYTHSLMTPMFTPTNSQYGRPKIAVAAVGPLMTQVASEVADGIILHAFNTEKYIRETLMPNIDKGLAKSQRSRSDFEVSFPMFVVCAEDEESFEQNKRAAKQQIAFYGSTPAYKNVLDCHGWGDLQPELNKLSKDGKWVEMANLISDEILDVIAVVGEPIQVAEKIRSRYGDIVNRTTLNQAHAPTFLCKQFEIIRG